MSHFGFMCPPFLGHLNPMQAVAGELIERGHRVTFVGFADMAGLLRGGRCRFAPLGASTHPPGAHDRITAHMVDPRGLKLFRIVRDMAGTTDMLCREAPAIIGRHGIDTLVVDQLEPAGGLIAQHLGLPIVSVANALLIDREPKVPPPFTGWRYDPTDRGIRRNRGGYRVGDAMMFSMRRVIARQASAWRLAAHRRIDNCLSSMAQITQTVPGFDFPREALPATMHHCGPLRSDDGPADLDGLLGDGRPLVFASLGTLQGGRARVFHAIAQACLDLDLHLVIAHGGRLSGAEVAALPGAPVVRSFVPQRGLLDHAALAVTNGGLNTVMDALAAGVPIVAIPIAFEQAAIGARLEACGAGLTVPLNRLTAGRLGAAIRKTLAEPRFAAAAADRAKEIRTAGGVTRAASVAEAVARCGRAVTTADLTSLGRGSEPMRSARS